MRRCVAIASTQNSLVQRKLWQASALFYGRFFNLCSISPISALIALMVSFCIAVLFPSLVSTTLSRAFKWAFLALSVSDRDELFCIAAFMASILGVI